MQTGVDCAFHSKYHKHQWINCTFFSKLFYTNQGGSVSVRILFIKCLASELQTTQQTNLRFPVVLCKFYWTSDKKILVEQYQSTIKNTPVQVWVGRLRYMSVLLQLNLQVCDFFGMLLQKTENTFKSQYDFLDVKVTETGKKSPGCPAMLNSILPLLFDESITGSCHSRTECLWS